MSDVTVDRDFDTARPTTFRIRGEVFRLRSVAPEEYARALREAEEVEKGKPKEGGAEGEREEVKLEDLFAARDVRVLLSIHPDDHEKWRELRGRPDNTVDIKDMTDLIQWLTEVHTGRPTILAASSSDGPGSSAASSTAQSSSQEARQAS